MLNQMHTWWGQRGPALGFFAVVSVLGLFSEAFLLFLFIIIIFFIFLIISFALACVLFWDISGGGGCALGEFLEDSLGGDRMLIL